MLEDFTLSSHAITSRFRTDPLIDTSFFDISARSFSTFPRPRKSSILLIYRPLCLLTEFWIVIFERFGFFFTILNIPTPLYPLISPAISIFITLSIIISQSIFYILPSNVSTFIPNLCSFSNSKNSNYVNIDSLHFPSFKSLFLYKTLYHCFVSPILQQL